nr:MULTISPECIES: L,D-transpeptidase family protein [unclassified Paenibacillus]
MLLACCLAGTAKAGESSEDLIIVNKKTNKLAYYRNGVLEKEFSVATGRTTKLTPEGKFKIVSKIKNRPYYKDNIPGGDPKNPLGDRWLGLEVGKTYGTTYAIHGNNNPDSIGKYVSAGCIRMNNDEIHWLYDQVKMFTYVVITNSKLSFDEIAAKHQYPLLKTFKGTLMIDGETKPVERELILYKDRVFVPLRNSFELIGGTILWDQSAKTVTATIGNRTIVHQAETKSVEVNGEPMELTLESRNLNGTIMIPLRDVAQMSGYNVEWDAMSHTIIMTSPAAPAPAP